MIDQIKITPPIMSTIADRIEWAREHRGMSRATLIARSIPPGKRSAYNHLMDTSPQTSKYYLPIAIALGARMEWLVNGEGEWEAADLFTGPDTNVFHIEEGVLILCAKAVDTFIQRHSLPAFADEAERLTMVARLYEEAMSLPQEDRTEEKLITTIVTRFFRAFRK